MASRNAGTAVLRDYYRILQLPRTASASQIKESYRRLALEHHPDFHGGCTVKLEEFKILTEAYETLGDRARRNGYDREFFGRGNATQYGHMGGIDEDRWKKKVYAPRPPPNFKRFDHDRFQKFHYGNGLLEEEIAIARGRADRAAEAAGSKVEFHSPLGREAVRGGANGGTGVYYTRTREGMSEGARVQRAKVAVVDRMNQRRAERNSRRANGGGAASSAGDDSGCSVM